MRRVLVLFFFVATQTPACLTPPPSVTPSGQIVLPPETIRQFSKCVFEVVTPKVEDENTKFKEPLPVDLLPFAERNDKFVGLGTAFAVSPTRFVTAAHVIPTYLATSRERYYLRDSSGAIYEIGRITKYSQYRDLVEFELVQPPANAVGMDLRTTADIGEPVLTVGNARGEGIVLRSGSITSFTPEPADGQWKFLRFTAPTSPGNSGGPLVDASGRVLGVVVQKSEAENLNYAVPIDELHKLSSDKSEFWIKGIQIDDDHQQLFAQWKFTSPLPASLASLREASKRSFSEFLATSLSDFDTKFANDIFPNHPNLPIYLREVGVPFGLGQFSLDGHGKWEIAHRNYTDKELAPGQRAHFFETADKRAGEIIIDRPRDVSLSAFFESPKMLVDALIHNYSWAITFAAKRITIETLGDPSEKERWVDDYGRPWFTYVWQIKRSDEVVLLNCLTNPGGWACEWKNLGAALEEGMRIAAKRAARRTTFSYYGRITDWVEFLALPETYRPKVLAHAVVRIDRNLTIDFPLVSGSVDLPLLSETSMLFAYPGIDPFSLKEQRIVELRVIPRRDKSYSFGVQEVLEPVAKSSETHVQFWKNLQAMNPPYDNALVIDGKTNVIRRVAKPPAKSDGKRVYLYYCRSGTEDAQSDLKASCAKFQDMVKIGRAVRE